VAYLLGEEMKIAFVSGTHAGAGTVAVAFLSLVFASAGFAQEKWCQDNPSVCVCSETFQHTSYSTTPLGNNSFNANGNLPNSKPCRYEGAVSFQSAYGSYGDMRDRKIASDSAILSRLPLRNSTSMARYIRPAADSFGSAGYPSAFRVGYDPINLTGVKRIGLRFYRYFSENYEFAFQGSCTNGKIAHNSATNWSPPFYTIQSYGDIIGANYSFVSPQWNWAGHANLGGFFSWMHTDGADGAQNLVGFRGKWARVEVIVRRPKLSDSMVQGYDLEIYLTNVTDRGVTKQDTRLSGGCRGCVNADGVQGKDFVWNTGVYPNADMSSLHVEDYRAGVCNGWTGYAYAVVAAWPSDSGQMIGPAGEVEGGGAPAPGGDLTAPAVAIIAPVPGATVKVSLASI
jgi:hypothetical protein